MTYWSPNLLSRPGCGRYWDVFQGESCFYNPETSSVTFSSLQSQTSGGSVQHIHTCTALSDQRPVIRPREADTLPDLVNYSNLWQMLGFPGGSDGQEAACNLGDPGSIPVSGRSPGEGNGHPLQYSCLENPMDGGSWQAIVHRVVKSRTWLKWLHFTDKCWAFQVALVVKNLPPKAGDVRDAGSIPGSGRSSEGGHGNPL